MLFQHKNSLINAEHWSCISKSTLHCKVLFFTLTPFSFSDTQYFCWPQVFSIMPHENVKPKHIIVANSAVVPQLEDCSLEIRCRYLELHTETHEDHALSHEFFYWFYHHTIFEDKQAISVYVPVWDLHNWQIWHIWSFLFSAPLWSFSALAAGDVYRRAKLVNCAELWWLLTSFLPKSWALWWQELPTLGCRVNERSWEGNQGQSGRFTANSIFRPSFTTSYYSPNHQKHDLSYFCLRTVILSE